MLLKRVMSCILLCDSRILGFFGGSLALAVPQSAQATRRHERTPKYSQCIIRNTRCLFGPYVYSHELQSFDFVYLGFVVPLDIGIKEFLRNGMLQSSAASLANAFAPLGTV